MPMPAVLGLMTNSDERKLDVGFLLHFEHYISLHKCYYKQKTVVQLLFFCRISVSIYSIRDLEIDAESRFALAGFVVAFGIR